MNYIIKEFPSREFQIFLDQELKEFSYNLKVNWNFIWTSLWMEWRKILEEKRFYYNRGKSLI